MYAAPNGISILQHIPYGSQPTAMLNSLDKSVRLFGDLDIPNFYNKTEVDTLFSNICLSNYHIKNRN